MTVFVLIVLLLRLFEQVSGISLVVSQNEEDSSLRHPASHLEALAGDDPPAKIVGGVLNGRKAVVSLVDRAAGEKGAVVVEERGGLLEVQADQEPKTRGPASASSKIVVNGKGFFLFRSGDKDPSTK